MKTLRHITGIIATAAVVIAGSAHAAEKKTIGLALTGVHPVFAGQADKDCPEGFQFDTVDNYKALYPDEEERNKTIGEGSAGLGPPEFRGPNAESIAFRPWLFTDPLPFREFQTKIAHGRNLDGTKDGQATDRTCKHEKFSSPDGSASDIDNQLLRVVGCWKAVRKGGFVREFFNGNDLIANANARFLIEISDVDDEKNDDHVDVTFYKGRDKITLDASGTPMPWLSQRVDRRDPDYTQHTTGKIVNGELITESMPLFVRPFVHNGYAVSEYETKDMQLRLKVGATHAQGIMSGYFDIATWWFSQIKNVNVGVSSWSQPAGWAALVRYADGYKDPKTGQCTAISAAYEMEAVRVYIVKDEKKPAVSSENNIDSAPKTVQTAAIE